MSQNTSPAVMEQRAPGSVEADDDLRALYRKLEFFPTPPWAGRAAAEIVLRLDPTAEAIWEPACGQGHLLEPLREFFPPSKVIGTDIHAHGCGSTWDFLGDARLPLESVQWVITNPPFPRAADFVRKAKGYGARGIAILCRNAFMESAGRYHQLWGEGSWLSVVAPFIERVPMQLGLWDPKGSTATAYSWFIFLSPELRKSNRIGPNPVIWPIPPGTKARLTKPDDPQRFGASLALPLFTGESS